MLGKLGFLGAAIWLVKTIRSIEESDRQAHRSLTSRNDSRGKTEVAKPKR